jgi:hypothetical protein
MDMSWAAILASNINSADISIVACVVAIIFFMKFNKKEGKNKANRYIGICLGVGFLALIAFRIVKGFL